MQILKQSTQVIVRVGPFVDVGDGFTPQTDIGLAGNEAELLKNASVEVDISGRTFTAVTNCRGWYDLTLITGDTDTVGLLTVVVQDDSDCLPVFRDFQVVEESIYASLFAASAVGFDSNQRVNVGKWLSQAVTLSTNNKPDVNIDEISDDQTAASNLELFTEILENATGLIDAGSFKAGAINAAAIADAAIDNATFAADVGSTVYASNIIALAVRKVLDELNLDHLLKVVTAAANMTTEVVDNTIFSRILANGDTSAFVPSTDGLQPIRDRGDAAWAGAPEAVSGTFADVSSGVYDLTATLGTLATFDDAYPNMIICFYDNSGDIYETKRITDYDGTGATRVTVDSDLGFVPQDGVDTFVIYRAAYAPVGEASVSEADRNAIADQVWDEAQADHIAQGSTGQRQQHSGRGRY